MNGGRVALGLGAALDGGLLRPWIVRLSRRRRSGREDYRVTALCTATCITRAITIAVPPAPGLEPNDRGIGTRLLSRERKVRRRGGGRLRDLLVFPAHFVMDTGVLHGVRDRSERDRPVDGVVGEAP